MKTISTHTFKHTLQDVHKNTENRKFCFVIGAGASRKSGIPTGGELSVKWFAEIKDRLEHAELKKWMEEQRIDEDDLAASYGSIYRKRFENDKTSGYEFLVQAMKTAQPSFGHIVLAQILSRIPGHCVLTTNFDSLVESSVYQFTNKTPLVCGHESLSGYARPSQTHPLIIKVHRDLLLEPKSDSEEINNLAPGWEEPLDYIFSTYIPVVIGYGGNDGSLMNYFENMNRPSNFFWCGLNENNISERIKNLIKKHGGSFVTIQSFDELMFELLWVFDEIKPIEEELNEITSERLQIVRKQLEELTTSKNKEDTKPTKGLALIKEKKELSALEYDNLADKEPDFEKRKQIYLEALAKYPSTGWLWWRFTYFLYFTKKDYDGLDTYYQKALKFNKNEAGVLGNYALFLQYIKKDYTKAEEYYLKALAADPNKANNNGNYALFLKKIKKDYTKAEEYYLKALAADPNNANINGNYAIFLETIKKDYTKAEEYYLKALATDPNNADINGSYAAFLRYIKKDYTKAEEYYLKALAADPGNAMINGHYASFLRSIKKDNANAEGYYLKALAADHGNAIINGNYAQILLEKGQKEEAQKYIEIALKAEETNSLLIELWFYRYAHFPEFLSEAENKIEELLSKGIRSLGWDFSGNIKQAIKEKHPNPEKLKEFARRISAE